MYPEIKSFLTALIPARLIYRHESILRAFLYLLYRGNRYQCNVCERKLRKFVQLKNNSNLICPSCGSAGRTRRLWSLLQKEYLKDNIKVLHFSPSRSLFRKLKENKTIEYVSTDFAGEFFADRKYDITDIPEHDGVFDLVICYHVLEHIENDKKAISELYRIIKPAGLCLLQTPFREGDTLEDPAIKMPQERLKHYGQKDHLRIYSINGLKNRLAEAGFNVEIREFREDLQNYYGFKAEEQVIIAKKQES